LQRTNNQYPPFQANSHKAVSKLLFSRIYNSESGIVGTPLKANI
jgi:hypothetical protein